MNKEKMNSKIINGINDRTEYAKLFGKEYTEIVTSKREHTDGK